MATLSNCTNCHSTQFDEVETSIPVSAQAGVTKSSSNLRLWLRVCHQCSQVTIWAKPAAR